MLKRNKLPILSLAVLLALLAAAVMPLSAFAQDEVPPVEVPAVVVEEVVEEVIPAVEESAPAEETTPAAEESAPAVEESPTVPEILEALPEGTDLVVLDEVGDALPLATQEAAEVVAAADDPFFWDGTQYVGYSTTGTCAAQVTVCNTSATPLQSALDAFRDTPTATGSIYVAAGTYNANVSIDGSTGNLANLTGLIGEGSGLTTLNGNLTLYGLNIGTNVFTFQGFTLANGELLAYDNTATLNITDVHQYTVSGSGIQITTHTGNVNLTEVSVNNPNTGIFLDISGNATIVDSEMANGTYGIFSLGGAFILNNGNVHDNDYGAAGLDETSVIGCSTFASNGDNTLGSVTFDAAACGVKGQDKLPFPKAPPVVVPPVVPPSGVIVLGDDNEIKNVFAPLFDQIIVVTTPSTAGDLPESLPAGKTFVAGASLTLMQNGEEIESAPGGVQAFFEIPAGMEPPFVVLFWNGSEWVEIPSQVVGGKVVFTVTKPGVYVLVGG
jgi:hypothetical protein